MFPFDQLGTAAHHALREAEEAGSALVRTAQDAVGWAGDLFAGNVGVQAMPVPAVVSHVMAGDSSSWTTSGIGSGDVAAAHHQIAAELTTMLNNLEPTWTGKGAESAKQRTKAFSDLVERAAKTLGSNGSNVTDAAYGFELAKRSMEPMGERPDKSFFDVATPWDTDTEDAIAAYNAKAQKNLEIYDAYVAHLEGQGQGLSGDYGQLNPATSAVPEDTKPADAHRVTATRDERPTELRRDDGDATSSDRQLLLDVGPGSTEDGRRNDAHVPVGTSGPGVHPEAFEPAGVTRTAGVLDGRTLSGLPLMSQLEQAVGNPLSDSDGRKLAGVSYSPLSSAPNAGTPLRAGTGEVGSAPPRRSPSAGGRVTAVGRGAGRARIGSASVGPAGQARPAEEDAEHQRKYVRDDDSVFADVEDGLVDPRTGFVPVPPTIGT
ncbi:hypothetical protein SAMN05421837_112247 [Amycolatopsis pretoriensis]|uniref:PPE family protein n=1 Tax=Amycolatopsis pretoriensis TaxID=218821 RepID=A0A1H5RGD1_9PSEU|nr:hypothetical protein [Amycolatopsis pretoriensis]SEF37134.1 hypothetical protein SAMN05421837_112247 [Amycolatopsis pretoriensis]